MCGAKEKNPAVHRTLGGHQLRVAFLVRIPAGRSRLATGLEHYSDLVGQDLLRGAHALEAVGVDHFLQLRHQELVGEHRELDDEGPDLLPALLTLLEPGGVLVAGDDAVLE